MREKGRKGNVSPKSNNEPKDIKVITSYENLINWVNLDDYYEQTRSKWLPFLDKWVINEGIFIAVLDEVLEPLNKVQRSVYLQKLCDELGFNRKTVVNKLLAWRAIKDVLGNIFRGKQRNPTGGTLTVSREDSDNSNNNCKVLTLFGDIELSGVNVIKLFKTAYYALSHCENYREALRTFFNGLLDTNMWDYWFSLDVKTALQNFKDDMREWIKYDRKINTVEPSFECKVCGTEFKLSEKVQVRICSDCFELLNTSEDNKRKINRLINKIAKRHVEGKIAKIEEEKERYRQKYLVVLEDLVKLSRKVKRLRKRYEKLMIEKGIVEVGE